MAESRGCKLQVVRQYQGLNYATASNRKSEHKNGYRASIAYIGVAAHRQTFHTGGILAHFIAAGVPHDNVGRAIQLVTKPW